MEGLLISNEDLGKLQAWVDAIPTKYGMELVLFLNNCKAKQAASEKTENQETPT